MTNNENYNDFYFRKIEQNVWLIMNIQNSGITSFHGCLHAFPHSGKCPEFHPVRY